MSKDKTSKRKKSQKIRAHCSLLAFITMSEQWLLVLRSLLIVTPQWCSGLHVWLRIRWLEFNPGRRQAAHSSPSCSSSQTVRLINEYLGKPGEGKVWKVRCRNGSGSWHTRLISTIGSKAYVMGYILKLERIQRIATKMVLDLEDLIYEERLIKEMHLTTLKEWRKIGDLITIYKLMNILEETDRKNLILLRRKGEARNLRGHKKK